jgi:hypothetical protein
MWKNVLNSYYQLFCFDTFVLSLGNKKKNPLQLMQRYFLEKNAPKLPQHSGFANMQRVTFFAYFNLLWLTYHVIKDIMMQDYTTLLQEGSRDSKALEENS